MAVEELLIRIKSMLEDGGFKQTEQRMRSMENATKASSTKMKNDLNQVNNTRFDGLANKFKSTISGMVSTAKAGASSIKDSLTSMTSSMEGALAGVAGAYSSDMLFEKAMSKALTTTQLKNVKPKEYQSIMSQYLKFTEKSSASDEDINKMLRFTYTGDSKLTYKALNALDAVSYSADKLQRMEGIRGWGTYLTGGWESASGMMRDEPLTAQQKKVLQNAKTYEERLAALNQLAKEKGNLDAEGNSLSTTMNGELGKYNKSLAVQDAIVRGATDAFNSLMASLEPVITWFTKLDEGTKDIIGTFLAIAAVGTTLAFGLGIALQVLGPVAGLVGKMKDALTGADKIKDGVSNLKDTFAGKKTVASMNVKAGVVNIKEGLDADGTAGGKGGKSRWSFLPGVTPAGTLTTAGGLGYGALIGGILHIAKGYAFQKIFGTSTTTDFISSLGNLPGAGGVTTIGQMFAGRPTKPTDIITSTIGSIPGMQWLNSRPMLKEMVTDPLGFRKRTLDAAGFKSQREWFDKPIAKWWNSWKISDFLPKFKWPKLTASDIIKVMAPKIPGLSWVTPKVADIIGTMAPKIPGFKWNSPGINSILNLIRPKIGQLQFPSLSRITAMINVAISSMMGTYHPTRLGKGAIGAGAPGLGDEYYGTGSYFEGTATGTTSQTVIQAPIGPFYISDKESGDNAVRQITAYLSELNKAKGN